MNGDPGGKVDGIQGISVNISSLASGGSHLCGVGLHLGIDVAAIGTFSDSDCAN